MDKFKILIVEDNPVTRKFVRVTLESENYMVFEAPNGKTALEITEKNIPSLVLMDLRLPDMGGCELAKSFRESVHMKGVPLIAFTGLIPQNIESNVIDADFNGFILKPTVPSQLLHLIRGYLQSHEGPQPFSNKRLLLVDDDHSQLRLSYAVMTQLGFTVTTAQNGIEALEKIRKSPPDVIVSDVLMPLMDGFKLCMTIKGDEKLKNIPVILMSSSFLEKEDLSFALSVGASNLVLRTPDLKYATSALTTVFERKVSTPTLNPSVDLDHYQQRMIKQLERQSAMNATLLQQSLSLNLVSNIASLIAKNRKIEGNLGPVFAQCLDLAGLSFGAIFLTNTHGVMRLRTQVGFSDSSREFLKGVGPKLEEWMLGTTTLCVPSKRVAEGLSADFLNNTNLKNAILTSIMAGQHRIGILLLGADAPESNREWIPLAESIAMQLGQAISLSQAATKLTLTEDRAQMLMDNANDGIILTDFQGKILEVNKIGLELFGRSSPQVIGHYYKEFTPPGQEKKTDAEYKRATAGPSVARNIGILRPDGKIVEVDFSTSIVQVGEDKLMFSVAHDVTERNRLQQASIQNEKLATMGTLTAGVAHEINNPLSSILANVELLTDCMSQVKPETLNNKREWIERTLKQITEGVSRVKSIAGDLKVFSRSRDTEKETIINVESILDSSINMVAHEIKSRAKVIRAFGKVSPIRAHEGRLGQVFLNLLLNAAQAISEGSADKNEIKVTTEMRSGGVSIKIQDSGCGMPPDVLKRLFTPFFTTKPVGLGTGLGLSICQNIINGIGGEIKVESVVNVGTTFEIWLPAVQESKETQPSPIPIKVVDGRVEKGRIMIIDDEPELAEVYGQVLSRDHEVEVFTSGRKAFEVLTKDNNFDAIFSDLTMPDMAGIDLYHELKKLNKGIEEKIIFITGGVFTQRAQEFVKSVPNKIVEKPIETKMLRQLAQEFVLKNRGRELKVGA